MTIEQVAKACHEANRALCAAFGDHSQPSWAEAPPWQVESARKGVKFHRDNPEAGPEASHVSWRKEKEAQGWIYGEKKDPIAKTHPCLVKFSELPPEQQAKDFVFVAIVRAFS